MLWVVVVTVYGYLVDSVKREDPGIEEVGLSEVDVGLLGPL